MAQEQRESTEERAHVVPGWWKCPVDDPGVSRLVTHQPFAPSRTGTAAGSQGHTTHTHSQHESPCSAALRPIRRTDGHRSSACCCCCRCCRRLHPRCLCLCLSSSLPSWRSCRTARK